MILVDCRMSILSHAFIYGFLISLLFLARPTITSSSSSSSSLTGTNQPKSVKILLQSKWSQTPLYLEVAEFLSEENQDFYWQFLEDLQPNLIKTNGNLSQYDQYELSVRLATKLLRSEEKLSILKFSLSLRSYSPKVITFKNIIDDIVDNQLKDCDGAFLEASVPVQSGQQWSRYFCGDNLQSIREWMDNQMNFMQTKSAKDELDHPMVYSVDHIYPGKYSSLEASSTMITLILYANIGSEQFFRLHDFLKEQISMNKPIRYLIRHYPPNNVNVNKVALSGYGVELAIKSTEYKAQDDSRVRGEVVNSNLLVESEQTGPDEVAGFVFSRLKSNNALLAEKLNDFRSYLIDQEKEIATLKVWELQEISLQAVTKVLSVQKEKALAVLKEISQNFPSVARSLVKIHVEPELKREIIKNQNLFYQNLNLATSDTALFVNGLYHDVDALDVFTLLDTVRQEFNTVSKLHSLLNGDHERIRKLDTSWDRQQNFDFQLDIRDAAVQYINDIENDRMYRGWPSSLNELLRPTYPGMLRNIRRNMYHLILVVNPAKKECFDMLRMAESFYIHKAPVRIGLVFDVSDNLTLTGYQDAGVAALQAYNYIAQEKTPYEALSFLTDVIANVASQNADDGGDLKPDDIISHFKSKIKPQEDLEDIFGAESSYDTGRKLSRDFLSRTGLQNGPKALLNGVLLKESHLNADYFEDAVLSEIMRQSSQLQKAIYKNELTDQHDILDWLMSKKSVMSRLNKIILGLDQPKNQPKMPIKVLDLTSGQLLKGVSDADHYYRANINDLQLTLASTIRYINSKKDCNPVTVWLASDFQSSESRRVFLAALNHLKQNSRSMRLALVYADHNPITVILDSALNTITSSSQLLAFFIKLIESIDSTNVDKDLDVDAIGQLVPEEYRQAFLERHGRTDSSFGLHQAVSSRLFNLVPNTTGSYDHLALVLNGKIFKIPVRDTSEQATFDLVFNEDDFALMERFVQNFWSDKILAVLDDAERNSGTRKCSDLVLRICSVLLAKQATAKQRYDISNVNEDHSVLTLEPPLADQPFIELNVILDPLSRGAQKISPILETFYKVFNTKIRIYFNAVDKHSDMPLKLFYRFVLDHQPRFDQAGRLTAPFALFQAMPTTPLFTLGMSVPENWMVEAVEAVYDLDNIHLAQVSGNVVGALFELEHLLVEGHCFEQSSGSPPRGLQITLGTESTPTMYDTIVMANLGYFQLKAAPGVWLLRLRQGRSSDIYSIVSQEGSDQVIGTNNGDVITLVNSFRSLVIKLRVSKKPGKQHEELLYDSDESIRQESGGWFSSWNTAQSDREKGAADSSLQAYDEDEDSKRINIFSVASGHLYERLLRIMMLSVLKHTQTPVKFWFLKNYLSPHFKKVLPFMAQKYNFQYELVQYKWPRWLHQQTEKQRIIWGYKILFLDVLFPLDVKKIIFVDADQVVRADLKELRDLDLEGAPYGYTPFCDSRKDMDGFRFWKSGYWATHLHGRKYHISALYVVDLQKFRRIAAGDRLRGQYQGLSQDPNSLSNLDQDLPNNMIHQVAIKSLPQEWLWCETWCDDQSKSRAKTIDLCNNPKTKEPKLTAARRIVAEWEDYDRELREFLEELQQQIHLNQTKTDHQTAPIIEEEIHYQADSAKQEAGDSHSHQEL